MTAARLHDLPEDSERLTTFEQSFPRKYWLKRRRLIRPLFDRSRDDVQTCAAGSIRIVARLVPREETGEDVPVQVGFSAGPRVRNAVERNYIRRLIRETFRRCRQRVEIVENESTTCTMMILYRSNPSRASEAIPQDLPRAVYKFCNG